jgi:hypothetical protein
VEILILRSEVASFLVLNIFNSNLIFFASQVKFRTRISILLSITSAFMKDKKISRQEGHPVKLNIEEIELIRKALHLEEMSICEILMDDIVKYRHQLNVIENLYKKLS